MNFKHLKGIVFDWAGTMVDHGSLAPAVVFQRVFEQKGVEISIDEARGPMGMAKREHIEAVASSPRVSEAWKAKFGSPCDQATIDEMYAEFIPAQKSVLSEYCTLIAGAADVAAECRSAGLKIGSSTGYTHELMDIVSPLAAEQGYAPDLVLCAEDTPRGRPAPFLIFEFAKRLDVYPMWHVVKVDDTTVGIEAGRNAGCWTIGISKTGNLVGMTAEEFDCLDSAEQERVCQVADEKLHAAGAHFTARSVADILPQLAEIDQRIDAGESPVG